MIDEGVAALTWALTLQRIDQKRPMIVNSYRR